jgi:hypothetical protein
VRRNRVGQEINQVMMLLKKEVKELKVIVRGTRLPCPNI